MKTPSRSQEALRHSKPLILTALVNRIGTIGISLLPILLVQRQISAGTSAFIMAGVKSVVIYGTLIAGVLNDRLGARKSLLLGFFAVGVGLSALPFQSKAALILICAMIAQFGDSLIRVSIRMLLTLTVPRPLHKEAFAWLRTVNNFGQIFSFGLGTLGNTLGLLPLMIFDGVTGFFAYFVGKKIIPPMEQPARTEKVSVADGKPKARLAKAQAALAVFLPAIACALILATWNFYYELFMSGMAARLEIIGPGRGLAQFSRLMLLNTAVCAFLAVKMADWVSRPSRVFLFGLSLTVLGIYAGVLHTSKTLWVGLAIAFVTLGEIFLGALSQFVQVRTLPTGRAEGFFYSAMVVVAQCGRLLGAALAFPWIAHAAEGKWEMTPAFWIPAGMVALLLVRFGTAFNRAVED